MQSKFPSIAIGSLVYAILGVIGSFLAQSGGSIVGGVIGCLAAIIGCGAAVWHYTSTHQLTISAGQGAGLGALTGVVGGLIGWIIQRMFIAAGLLLDPVEQVRRQMQDQGLSREQIDQAVELTESFSGPVGIVVGIVIAAILGAIIGAIAAVIFKTGGDDELVTEL